MKSRWEIIVLLDFIKIVQQLKNCNLFLFYQKQKDSPGFNIMYHLLGDDLANNFDAISGEFVPAV